MTEKSEILRRLYAGPVQATDIFVKAADEIERLTLEVATHKARADAAEKERDAAHSARRQALRASGVSQPAPPTVGIPMDSSGRIG